MQFHWWILAIISCESYSESLCNAYILNFFFIFPSNHFKFSGFTLQSSFHVELIFVQSDIKEANFGLMQIDNQLSQHHLLKRLSFLQMHVFSAFAETQISVAVQVYLWVFYFISLVYMSIFMPVLCCFYYALVVEFKVRYCDTSNITHFANNI
jgi:hypothetical protein